METIGQRVSRARALGDVSSRELSSLAGLSPNWLGQLERGDIEDTKTAVAARLAEVLGVELDWLITGAGPEPTEDQIATAIDKAREEAA